MTAEQRIRIAELVLENVWSLVGVAMTCAILYVTMPESRSLIDPVKPIRWAHTRLHLGCQAALEQAEVAAYDRGYRVGYAQGMHHAEIYESEA